MLFDEMLATLTELGEPAGTGIGPRVMRFEMVFLRELGYRPVLDCCAGCASPLSGERLAFSSAGGGVLCSRCQVGQTEKRGLSQGALLWLQALETENDWRRPWETGVRAEVRHLLGSYISYLRGRQPRLLPYLEG